MEGAIADYLLSKLCARALVKHVIGAKRQRAKRSKSEKRPSSGKGEKTHKRGPPGDGRKGK